MVKIPYTVEMKDEIKRQKKRTGLGAREISEILDNLPAAEIEKITESKVTPSVNESSYRAVLGAYETLPDDDGRLVYASVEKSPVTNCLITDLSVLSEQQASVEKILKNFDAPEGLTAIKVSQIRSGRIKSLPNNQLIFLEELVSRLRSIKVE